MLPARRVVRPQRDPLDRHDQLTGVVVERDAADESPGLDGVDLGTDPGVDEVESTDSRPVIGVDRAPQERQVVARRMHGHGVHLVDLGGGPDLLAVRRVVDRPGGAVDGGGEPVTRDHVGIQRAVVPIGDLGRGRVVDRTHPATRPMLGLDQRSFGDRVDAPDPALVGCAAVVGDLASGQVARDVATIGDHPLGEEALVEMHRWAPFGRLDGLEGGRPVPDLAPAQCVEHRLFGRRPGRAAVRLQREEDRELGVVRGRGGRVADQLGELGLGVRGSCVVALTDGEEPGDERDDEQHSDAHEQASEAPIGPVLAFDPLPLRVGFGRSEPVARSDELALQRIEGFGLTRGQLERALEAESSCEIAVVTVVLVPHRRCSGDLLADTEAVAGITDPVAESRPVLDERLVSHLHGRFARVGVVIEGEQPGVPERGQQASDLGRVGRQ